MAGFEPATFRSQSGRATNLRHIPSGPQPTVPVLEPAFVPAQRGQGARSALPPSHMLA